MTFLQFMRSAPALVLFGGLQLVFWTITLTLRYGIRRARAQSEFEHAFYDAARRDPFLGWMRVVWYTTTALLLVSAVFGHVAFVLNLCRWGCAR